MISWTHIQALYRARAGCRSLSTPAFRTKYIYIYIARTVGPTVCKQGLLWAIWSLREKLVESRARQLLRSNGGFRGAAGGGPRRGKLAELMAQGPRTQGPRDPGSFRGLLGFFFRKPLDLMKASECGACGLEFQGRGGRSGFAMPRAFECKRFQPSSAD